MSRFGGTLVVLAAAATLSGGCAESVRPLFVADVTLRPDSAFLRPDEEAVIEAVPRDNRGDALLDRTPFVRWIAEGEAVSVSDTLGAQTTVRGLDVGSGAVRAEIGRGVATTRVFVVPEGDLLLSIQPSPIVLSRGEGLDLTAWVVDSQGAPVSLVGHRVSWSFDQDDVALLSAGQSLTARLFGRASGTGRLTLVVSDRSLVETVTVR